MKCTKCKNELRIAQEQVGVNEQNYPIMKTFAYCDACRIKYDYDLILSKQPKKESVLSIISCVIAAVMFIPYALNIGIPIILSFPLFLTSIILALIDFGVNNSKKKHVGSIVALVFSFIFIVIGMSSCI